MEASLKQLRIRFTASMGLLSGVLLLLLSVILCLAVFVSAELTSATILETMLDRPDDEVVDERGRPSFLFAVTAEGNVTVMPAYADRLNIYGDNADEIIRSAVAQGDGKFSVDGMYFRVRSQEGPMGTQVFAVIDRTSDRQNLVTVASLVVLIYITSLLVAVLFFYLYSSYALAPVAESMQKQRDLIANASHELKTPLTVIATNLAVMKSEPQSTIEENAKWMDAIEAQIKRMNGLIVSMLQLSKMENAPLNPVDVDLSEVTEGACLGFDALCFEKGLRLVTRIAPGIHVMGDRDALDWMWYLWIGFNSPASGRLVRTFERAYIADKSTWVEPMDPYFTLTKSPSVCDDIMREFGVAPMACSPTGHIINGHTPVKTTKGEQPIRAEGKLLVIDGGFCRAYHPKTGIAGYTLISSSRGCRLKSHRAFTTVAEALTRNVDIESETNRFDQADRRRMVSDTDTGAKIRSQIQDLRQLLDAYRNGAIEERA